MIAIFLIVALLVVANSTQVLENQIKQLQAQVATMTASLQSWEQYLLRQAQSQQPAQLQPQQPQYPQQQPFPPSTAQQPPTANFTPQQQPPPTANFKPQSYLNSTTENTTTTSQGSVSAHGQNLTMPARLNANLPSIAGLNAQNIDNYRNNLDATVNTAKLHHASNATLAIFDNQQQVLSCVYLYLPPNPQAS